MEVTRGSEARLQPVLTKDNNLVREIKDLEIRLPLATSAEELTQVNAVKDQDNVSIAGRKATT